MVTRTDLKIKARLLHSGIDLAGEGILERVYDEKRVFLGTWPL